MAPVDVVHERPVAGLGITIALVVSTGANVPERTDRRDALCLDHAERIHPRAFPACTATVQRHLGPDADVPRRIDSSRKNVCDWLCLTTTTCKDFFMGHYQF